MNITIKPLHNFINHCRGTIAIEFALLLPFMILLFLGTFELANYVLVYNKINRVTASIGDMCSRAQLTPTQINNFLASASIISRPYNFTANGRAVVTIVYKASVNGAPYILSQTLGPGTVPIVSSVGSTVGGAATLPAGFTMNPSDKVVIVETTYNYVPLFGSYIFPSQTIYNRVLYRLRT